MNLIAVAYIFTGLAALIAQMVYFLLESSLYQSSPNKVRFKKAWHIAGGAIHLWMGIAIAHLFGWQYGLVMASLTWFFFDGAVNTWAFNREWFYIGTTALLDEVQQLLARILHIDVHLVSAILKIIFLLTSLFFLVWPIFK